MRFNKALCSLALAAVVVACSSSSAFADNLLVNPGFETGDFTGWTVNSDSDHPWQVGVGSSAFEGSYFASTGCVGAQCITGTASQLASLSQTVATTAGTGYAISFEFNTQNYGVANELDVLWDGVSVLDLGPGGTLGPIATYTDYTINVVGTGSDTLTFLGRQDPGYDSLDNISLSSTGIVTGTPEPSTLLMIGGILPVIGLLRRRLS